MACLRRDLTDGRRPVGNRGGGKPLSWPKVTLQAAPARCISGRSVGQGRDELANRAMLAPRAAARPITNSAAETRRDDPVAVDHGKLRKRLSKVTNDSTRVLTHSSGAMSCGSLTWRSRGCEVR